MSDLVSQEVAYFVDFILDKEKGFFIRDDREDAEVHACHAKVGADSDDGYGDHFFTEL